MLRALVRLCFFALTAGLLLGPALAGAGSGDRQGRVEGQLVELHRDVLDGPPLPGYGLDRGESTRMLDPDQPQALVGQQVAVEDTSNAPGLQGQAQETDGVQQLAAAAGTRTTAVVLVNFANNTSQPVTPAQMKSRVFTGAGSVSDFYEQQSGGTVELGGIADPTGDVFGWWTLPMNVPTACPDSSMMTIRQQAVTYGNSQGVNLNSYQHVILYFPDNPGCAWAGLGELPGNWSWINDVNYTSVIAHEVGHNMGVHHAATLKCGSQTLTSSTSGCSYVEYGDGFDVMGSSSALMSAWQRAKLSQLPTAARRSVTASGAYSLDQVNNNSATNPRLLIVPRKIGTSPVTQYFAIDLRAPFGDFDTFSPTHGLVTGVGIRLVPALSVIDVTRLLDAHPATGTFNDSALQPGESFTDPGSGVTITNSATAGGTATVQVSMGDQQVDTTPPSAPSLSASVSPLGVSLSWTAATDDVGVDHYEVRRDSTPIASTPANLRAYSDTSATSLRSASYRVVAYDAAGNNTQSTAVSVTIPDYVSPEMATIYATRLATGDVRLDMAATDERGVAGYNVSWPGGSATPSTGSWLHTSAPEGAFEYTVRARDAAGNVSDPLTVSVPATPSAAITTRTTRNLTDPLDGDKSDDPLTLAPTPVKPKFTVKRGSQGRFTVAVKGARTVKLTGGGLRVSVVGSKLNARLSKAMRSGRAAKLTVTASVSGKSYKATLTVRRGVVKLA